MFSVLPCCSSSLTSSDCLCLVACVFLPLCHKTNVTMLMCGLLCCLIFGALLEAVSKLWPSVLCWQHLAATTAHGISTVLLCACSLSSC